LSNVGTLNEKSLHAALKLYFEPNPANHEVPVGGYVADIVGERGIIEIQTGNFWGIREKLEAFLAVTDVTLVHPVPRVKWIVWPDGTRRKSPQRGTVYTAFDELIHIKPLLSNERLHVCVVLADMEERRERTRATRRGSVRVDRTIKEIADIVYIDDWRDLVPAELSEPFTSKNFAAAAHIPVPAAQTALGALYAAGAVRREGKTGNAYLYVKNEK